MNIFGVGLPEMAIIFVVALLIFGPKKLPEIGRSLGKAIKGVQQASQEFQDELKKEAEAIEKIAKTTMEATLDPKPPAPEPQAIAAAIDGAVDAQAANPAVEVETDPATEA